jgi:hypothetical protein
MRKSLLSGCLLAVFAALIVWLGQLLGLDLQHVALLGAALGGVLGLVPHQHGWGKLGGFAVGFVVAWLGFALRAAVLPDAASGRAVAAFLVILVCVVASAASRERLPLWSTLIGAVAIVAAYEESYTNSPSDFLNDSLAAARDERESSDGVRPAVTGTHPDGAIGATDPHHTDLDRILAGENS